MVDYPEDEEGAEGLEETSTEDDDTSPTPLETEQRSIREVLAEQQQEQRAAARRAELLRQRKEQDDRMALQRKRRTQQEQTERSEHRRVATSVRVQVRSELTAAGRSLAKAVRAAAAAPIPRYSAEGLEHRRMLRALEEVSAALRRASRIAGRSFDEGFDEVPQTEESVEAAIPEAV